MMRLDNKTYESNNMKTLLEIREIMFIEYFKNYILKKF